MSRLMFERKIAVVVVGFPATALFLGRARVCISAAHSREDLDYALEIMEQVTRKCCLQFHRKKVAPSLMGSARSASTHLLAVPPYPMSR